MSGEIRYEEISTSEAVNLSPHNHAYINPYNGCSMGCPFCFWLNDEGWEGRIQIKTNICQVLERQLKNWPKDQIIYLGSVCDPFNELENRYRLSEGCLRLIREYEIPLLITTSAVNEVVMEYAGLLKSMKQRVILVTELARLPEIQRMNHGGIHAGIRHANALKEMGLEVWATLAPLLPGIIELDPVLKRLNPEIPLYVDALSCAEGSAHGARTMRWIMREHTEYTELYRNIIENQDVSYFQKLLQIYQDRPQIHTFPFDFSQ